MVTSSAATRGGSLTIAIRGALGDEKAGEDQRSDDGGRSYRTPDEPRRHRQCERRMEEGAKCAQHAQMGKLIESTASIKRIRTVG